MSDKDNQNYVHADVVRGAEHCSRIKDLHKRREAMIVFLDPEGERSPGALVSIHGYADAVLDADFAIRDHLGVCLDLLSMPREMGLVHLKSQVFPEGVNAQGTGHSTLHLEYIYLVVKAYDHRDALITRHDRLLAEAIRSGANYP